MLILTLVKMMKIGTTIVYPVSYRSNRQSAFEYFFSVLSQGHAGRIPAVAPSPNCRFGFVNKRKLILKITREKG